MKKLIHFIGYHLTKPINYPVLLILWIILLAVLILASMGYINRSPTVLSYAAVIMGMVSSIANIVYNRLNKIKKGTED